MTDTDGLSLPPSCPPEGHIAAEGPFFRLARRSLKPGDATGPDDWTLPLYTRGSEGFGKADKCEAYALSLFDDIEVLRAARELVAWARKKSVARVELSPDMGRTLQTESDLADGHHEWWPASDKPEPNAEVIEAGVAA